MNARRHDYFARKMVARRSAGFTLLELMITVIILGILSTIALPNYGRYIVRGKISQATSQLSGMAITLQQYYQDNRTYIGACTSGSTAPLPMVASGDFTYSCSSLTDDDYSVAATGNPGTRLAGFVYTIDQNGNRATTAAPAGWSTSTSCWVINPNGSCN